MFFKVGNKNKSENHFKDNMACKSNRLVVLWLSPAATFNNFVRITIFSTKEYFAQILFKFLVTVNLLQETIID